MSVATSDKQEQIMKASLDLFIERGFDGTTMPMISKKPTLEREPFIGISIVKKHSSTFYTSEASLRLSTKSAQTVQTQKQVSEPILSMSFIAWFCLQRRTRVVCTS